MSARTRTPTEVSPRCFEKKIENLKSACETWSRTRGRGTLGQLPTTANGAAGAGCATAGQVAPVGAGAELGDLGQPVDSLARAGQPASGQPNAATMRRQPDEHQTEERQPPFQALQRVRQRSGVACPSEGPSSDSLRHAGASGATFTGCPGHRLPAITVWCVWLPERQRRPSKPSARELRVPLASCRRQLSSRPHYPRAFRPLRLAYGRSPVRPAAASFSPCHNLTPGLRKSKDSS